MLPFRSCVFIVCILSSQTLAWQKWMDGEDWYTPRGPGVRRGHSIDIMGRFIVLFGGRSNDVTRVHDPQTYEIIEVEGQLEFISFTSSHQYMIDKAARAHTFDGIDQNKTRIPVGQYYNDLWVYDLGCDRWADLGCQSNTEGWVQVDQGAVLGGCRMIGLGLQSRAASEKCSHPTERYAHAMAVFGEQWVVVMGGFSHRCKDFCGDVWVYNFDDVWHNPHECVCPHSDPWDPKTCCWRELANPIPSPGGRWRAATVVRRNELFLFGGHRLWHGFSEQNTHKNKWANMDVCKYDTVCAGQKNQTLPIHRMGRLPLGGYLDDLWSWNFSMASPLECPPRNVTHRWMRCENGNDDMWGRFKKVTTRGCAAVPLNSTAGFECGAEGTRGSLRPWRRFAKVEECYNKTVYADAYTNATDGTRTDLILRPEYRWEDRTDRICVVHWPMGRAAHTMVRVDGMLYVHGGFKTLFPYPTTASEGAAESTATRRGVRGINAYPTHPYYLNDLWRFDISGETWRLLAPLSKLNPPPRMEHTLVRAKNVLILFGGYRSNLQMNDMWYFNLTTSRWLQKKAFVHALFNEACVSDVGLSTFYNPLNNTWDFIEFPPKESGCAAAEDVFGHNAIEAPELEAKQDFTQDNTFGADANLLMMMNVTTGQSLIQFWNATSVADYPSTVVVRDAISLSSVSAVAVALETNGDALAMLVALGIHNQEALMNTLLRRNVFYGGGSQQLLCFLRVYLGEKAAREIAVKFPLNVSAADSDTMDCNLFSHVQGAALHARALHRALQRPYVSVVSPLHDPHRKLAVRSGFDGQDSERIRVSIHPFKVCSKTLNLPYYDGALYGKTYHSFQWIRENYDISEIFNTTVPFSLQIPPDMHYGGEDAFGARPTSELPPGMEPLWCNKPYPYDLVQRGLLTRKQAEERRNEKEHCMDETRTFYTNMTTVYRCPCSVMGQSTRGAAVDGVFGRAKTHIFVRQRRRQSPGWDGCRDRSDGRGNMPWKLQWLEPTPRSHHSAVWSEEDEIMLVYGGISYNETHQSTMKFTHESRIVGDFWQFNVNACPKNCSNHGSCHFGFCYCHDGYYGVDCSNTSCAGDHCFYDEYTNEQHCSHCCHTSEHSYRHYDAAPYRHDERKMPCDLQNVGESNGVCDGFGQCQCAPPFITDDCSVKDCVGRCSGHGWCSVEYPVSRCMCDMGWEGLACSERKCLNDCSYPNGECVDGVCICNAIPNPYNQSRTLYYHPFGGSFGDGPETSDGRAVFLSLSRLNLYQGIDCSYIVPWSGADRPPRYGALVVTSIFVTSFFFLLISDHWGG